MNTVRICLHKVAELTSEEQFAVSALSSNVYPPEEEKAWKKGTSIEWASTQWCAVCWGSEKQALSYVGAVIRTGMVNGALVKIGGVRGVKTHTNARRQGLASQAIERVFELFREQAVDFAFLVCEPNLVPLYKRLGWQSFTGDVLVTQRGKNDKFTFNLPMTRSVCASAPTDGVIDLMGPPW